MLIITDQNGNQVECAGTVRITSPNALWPRALLCDSASKTRGDAPVIDTDYLRSGRALVLGLAYPIKVETSPRLLNSLFWKTATIADGRPGYTNGHLIICGSLPPSIITTGEADGRRITSEQIGAMPEVHRIGGEPEAYFCNGAVVQSKYANYIEAVCGAGSWAHSGNEREPLVYAVDGVAMAWLMGLKFGGDMKPPETKHSCKAVSLVISLAQPQGAAETR